LGPRASLDALEHIQASLNYKVKEEEEEEQRRLKKTQQVQSTTVLSKM